MSDWLWLAQSNLKLKPVKCAKELVLKQISLINCICEGNVPIDILQYCSSLSPQSHFQSEQSKLSDLISFDSLSFLCVKSFPSETLTSLFVLNHVMKISHKCMTVNGSKTLKNVIGCTFRFVWLLVFIILLASVWVSLRNTVNLIWIWYLFLVDYRFC